jgi:hypothetical protein
MKSMLPALGAVSLIACPAAAQTAQTFPGLATTIAPPAAPIAAPPSANAVLRAGTPVQLQMMEEVTTKKKAAKVGQRFMLEVAAPVEVNGVVVIPAGTPAWGEIVGVRNKGMWGKSGHLDAKLLFARVNGRQIRLTGSFDDKGKTGTAGVVGAVAFVPIAGFFMTGTSAVLPKGHPVGGFIDEDVPLAMADVQPAPLQVGGAVATEAATPAAPGQ